ncbi:hypothetical protein PILCRDRAFT_96423 [Piloderma croceum F 1598]|uniref:Alcohol dehydrogenase-like C-terminal domain-containing protein n=1 Tax=Piloderma croceum (strain F 1598) TaxID=765440 RepID=A0A0C3FMI7_PILCF|nr:hypothetical protein PILCRDRAFT_96423 [Piloderma croceum F 1598]
MMDKIQKTLMLETDVPETVNEMIVSVRKMGRCGIIAVPMRVRLIGNGQAPVHKYWEEILNFIMAGKFDPTFMITHRGPLEDMSKLYATFDKRQAGVKKVFVETQFSSPLSKGCPQLTRVVDWPA